MRLRIHKKKDGYLMIKPEGHARYLTFIESILWALFGKTPKQPTDGAIDNAQATEGK